MEPFLSGVGLVFLLWEQPVVARVASPSPVVLVDFSFLARPDLAAGILVRWPCPGQESRTPCHFLELLDLGRVAGSLWIWGRGQGASC